MKSGFFLILLTTLCVAKQDEATVRFTNGDKISGHAVAFNPMTLTWDSTLLKQRAEFELEQILDLRLPSKLDLKAIDAAGHEAILELTNSDTVKGVLMDLDEKQIRLKTWYAGEMVFPRDNVKEIKINKSMKVYYRGPDGIDDWKINGNPESWKFDDGELFSSRMGSIAREIDFPEEVKISFESNWRGSFASKIVVFSSDTTSNSPNDGYEITFRGSYVQLRRISDDTWLASKINSRAIRQNEKASFEILMSRKTGRIAVNIDGDPFGIWDDQKLMNIRGKGLHFFSSGNSRIGISNITVCEWDGYMNDDVTDVDPFIGAGFQGNIRIHRGGRSVPRSETKALPEGRMMLSNGDTIEGEVLGIENEMIKIKTPFTEVSFPVHRIKNIALDKGDYSEAKKNNGDVRALLADGSQLVFRLEDVKEGYLIGYSQNFGRAEFLQSAFKQIEFNLYPKRKAN